MGLKNRFSQKIVWDWNPVRSLQEILSKIEPEDLVIGFEQALFDPG